MTIRPWDTRRELWCRCVGKLGLLAEQADEFVDEYLGKYPSIEWHRGVYCPIEDGDYLILSKGRYDVWHYSPQEFWSLGDGTRATTPPEAWSPIIAPIVFAEE